MTTMTKTTIGCFIGGRVKFSDRTTPGAASAYSVKTSGEPIFPSSPFRTFGGGDGEEEARDNSTVARNTECYKTGLYDVAWYVQIIQDT
jgi:hypothetical protein